MSGHRIEGYSFGNMAVDGKTFTRDLILFPDRIQKSWQREKSHHLKKKDLKEILSARPDILVLGTGAYGKMEVGKKAGELLEERGVELVAVPTDRAVNYYNRLQGKKRIVGAFHLTC